jgi:hypothetical protein
MLILYQWKNKGIMVPFYTLISVGGTGMLMGVLHRNFKDAFPELQASYCVIFGLLVAGIWTYLTCETYYKDKEGNKKKVDIQHQFYWIKMKYWAYILWGISGAVIIYKLSD